MSTTFFELPLIEWIGYGASTLVLISLSLSSIVKLRIYNLIGSALFSFYGFYIDALPVGIMNLIICFFNIYYLRTLLFKKEMFDGIWMTAKDEFVTLFINRHMKDIQRFFPDFTPALIANCHVLMAMRDMNVAGVFVTSQANDGHSQIVLDYVTPQYRDYKTGRYLLKHFNKAFIDKGVTQLTSSTQNESHVKYLKNIGFRPTGHANTYGLELI